MIANNMPLGSTALDRVASVLDNDIKSRYYWQLLEPQTAVAALVPLAYDFYDMHRTAREAANYNKSLPEKQRLDTKPNDTYFHQHGMYKAAQQGILSALLAAAAGELKEEYWDKPQKIKKGDSIEKIEEDRKKDLQNNYLAIKIALESNKPVDEVIIPNPTVQRIREMRNAKK